MVNALMQVKTDVDEILNAFCTPDSYTPSKKVSCQKVLKKLVCCDILNPHRALLHPQLLLVPALAPSYCYADTSIPKSLYVYRHNSYIQTAGLAAGVSFLFCANCHSGSGAT